MTEAMKNKETINVKEQERIRLLRIETKGNLERLKIYISACEKSIADFQTMIDKTENEKKLDDIARWRYNIEQAQGNLDNYNQEKQKLEQLLVNLK